MTQPVAKVRLTGEQARTLRAADALVRRRMEAAAVEAARHKVLIGEALAAGREAVESVVRAYGADDTLEWQMVGLDLVPVGSTPQE